MDVFTAGHSNRSAAELVALLTEASISLVVDVRRFPVSRRYPQHSRPRLTESLAAAGIGYEFLGDSLGGRLEPTIPVESSRNGAWRDPALRAYADALGTPEFQAGLAALVAFSRERPTAFMCAERDWRDCHRQIIADVLVARGERVIHLLRPGERELHRLHTAARAEETSDGRVGTLPTLRLSYPSLL